jgi:hypothetical protein
MDNALKTHLDSLDYETCWTDWRRHLKETIEGSREYYRDETITNLVARLNDFLYSRVIAESDEEELIADLWNARTAMNVRSWPVFSSRSTKKLVFGNNDHCHSSRSW